MGLKDFLIPENVFNKIVIHARGQSRNPRTGQLNLGSSLK